jgi:hypothetical protein
MSVVSFPTVGYVEIGSGIVQSVTITDHHGTHTVRNAPGQLCYHVDVVEADGGRITMWAGSSHARALEEAQALAPDYGAVRDQTGGAE